jgi:hypothetical protein
VNKGRAREIGRVLRWLNYVDNEGLVAYTREGDLQ